MGRNGVSGTCLRSLDSSARRRFLISPSSNATPRLCPIPRSKADEVRSARIAGPNGRDAPVCREGRDPESHGPSHNLNMRGEDPPTPSPDVALHRRRRTLSAFAPGAMRRPRTLSRKGTPIRGVTRATRRRRSLRRTPGPLPSLPPPGRGRSSGGRVGDRASIPPLSTGTRTLGVLRSRRPLLPGGLAPAPHLFPGGGARAPRAGRGRPPWALVERSVAASRGGSHPDARMAAPSPDGRHAGTARPGGGRDRLSAHAEHERRQLRIAVRPADPKPPHSAVDLRALLRDRHHLPRRDRRLDESSGPDLRLAHQLESGSVAGPLSQPLGRRGVLLGRATGRIRVLPRHADGADFRGILRTDRVMAPPVRGGVVRLRLRPPAAPDGLRVAPTLRLG